MSDRYRADFLFQGLFLLSPTEEGIDVWMPDARGPEPCYSVPDEALRQHAFALQLPYGSDWNRDDFPDNLIVNQVGQALRKELLHWKGDSMVLRVLNETIHRPAEAGVQGQFGSHFQNPVDILDDRSNQSVYHLVHFKDEVSDAPVEIAKMHFSVGCAWSERRSTRQTVEGEEEEIQWIEMGARILKVALAAELLDELLEALGHLARPLNLDLRVAMEIPRPDPLRLAVPGDHGVLEVQPPAEDGALEFVVHNREWAAIFAQSNEMIDDELDVKTDWDQEYLRKLAKAGIAHLTVPVPRDLSLLAPAGQGCGGGTRGYQDQALRAATAG